MGRPAGAKNRVTIAREEKAKADIARAISKGRAGGKADPRAAMDEIYKLHAICEGVAAKLRPRDIINDDQGFRVIGGDLPQFGEWIDRMVKLTELMAKYQLPPIKAMEAPSPAPDPEQLAKDSKIVFGLRVFEGGKPIEPLQISYEEDEE